MDGGSFKQRVRAREPVLGTSLHGFNTGQPIVLDRHRG